MKLYTVDLEQIIFHSISVLANSNEEASQKAYEIIKKQKTISTSQSIEITSINSKNQTLP